eukprot:728271_1
MTVTDHNTLRGGLEARRVAREEFGFHMIVLPGMEWTHCRGHYNFIFNEIESLPSVGDALEGTTADGQTVRIPLVKRPTDVQIREAFDSVHALGGLVMANHLPFSANNLDPSGLPSLT